MRTVLLKAVFSLLFLASTTLPAQTISLCLLRVPDTIARGSAAFTDAIGFTVGSDGVPQDVTFINAPFIDKEEAKACVASWNFQGSEGKHLVAALRWEQSKGWTSLKISGDGTMLAFSLWRPKPVDQATQPIPKPDDPTSSAH
jgi:hypothetical protein